MIEIFHYDFLAWILIEAKFNRDSGSLFVYDVDTIKECDFKTYNKDSNKIKEELKKSKGNTKVVAFRGNSVLLFNLNLFHETDTYQF